MSIKCKPLEPGTKLRLTVEALVDPTVQSARVFTVKDKRPDGGYNVELEGHDFVLNRDNDMLTGLIHWRVLDFDLA